MEMVLTALGVGRSRMSSAPHPLKISLIDILTSISAFDIMEKMKYHLREVTT